MKCLAKRRMAVLLILCAAVVFCACSSRKEDVLHSGLNAVITDIDAEHQLLTVKDPSTSDHVVFGEKSLISCEGTAVIYCNYETSDMQDISFSDLQVGDEILLTIRGSQLANLNPGDTVTSAAAEQIQLGTQRIN